MSGSDRESHPNVQEWSGGPSGCLGVVQRPSRMLGSGREWLGGPSECPEVVGRSSRMSESGREFLPDVREWS